MSNFNPLAGFIAKSKSDIVWVNAHGQVIPVKTMSEDYLVNLIEWTKSKIKEGRANKFYVNRTFADWYVIFNNILEEKTIKVEAKKVYDDLRIKAAKLDKAINQKNKEMEVKSKEIVNLRDQKVSYNKEKQDILQQMYILQETWNF